MKAPTPGVVCGVCGGPVYDPSEDGSERSACPRCGSLTRKFYRTVEDNLGFTGEGPGQDDEVSRLRNEVSRLNDAVGRLQAELDAGSRDPLTGLPNRTSLERTVAEHVGGLPDQPLAVLFMDIEKFKECNDTYGHDAGDKVLRDFARRVRVELGSAARLSRYGGDEFVAMLPSTDEAAAAEAATRVCASVRDPAIDVGGGNSAGITTSIGIACRPPHGGSASDLIRQADMAMYEAKRAGGDRFVVAAVAPVVHQAPPRRSAPSRRKPPRIVS